MSNLAIRVEHLTKQYRIGQRERYYTLRDTLANALASPFRGLRSPFQRSNVATFQRSNDNYIWALKDVSFDVRHGEVVGIIGRNGAGKSTLLKILSRITEPTEGRAVVTGRVGALLEVGTGFHPELTGRENIFLNGAILGMKKAEIERKFDEIVAFAEVEKFIDTPIKHYSSGMYVRLAFAVAAHLEPEILLVDEVLAVGDAAFQKKCLGKMGDVARAGRTVLFVSHNMAAVNRLCGRVIWLDSGCIQQSGNSELVVTSYLTHGASTAGHRRWEDTTSAPGSDKMRLRAVRIVSPDNSITATIDSRQRFQVEIEYEVFRPLTTGRVTLRVITSDGTVVFTSTDNADTSWEGQPRLPGRYRSICQVPGNLLNAGRYSLAVSADIPFVEILCREEDVLRFSVENTGGPSGRFPERWPGVICPDLPWRVIRL